MMRAGTHACSRIRASKDSSSPHALTHEAAGEPVQFDEVGVVFRLVVTVQVAVGEVEDHAVLTGEAVAVARGGRCPVTVVEQAPPDHLFASVALDLHAADLDGAEIVGSRGDAGVVVHADLDFAGVLVPIGPL